MIVWTVNKSIVKLGLMMARLNGERARERKYDGERSRVSLFTLSFSRSQGVQLKPTAGLVVIKIVGPVVELNDPLMNTSNHQGSLFRKDVT